MLEKPDLPVENIVEWLLIEYDLRAAEILFLPLGADINTAVYRIQSDNRTIFFLKLRKGAFDKTSVILPKFLSDSGIDQIISPLATIDGQLWGSFADYKSILYPFVAGHNGYEVTLAEHHWREFGQALKNVHTTPLPSTITNAIRKESFSPRYRDLVSWFLSRIDVANYTDSIAIKVNNLLRQKRVEIRELVQSAESLAQSLQKQKWISPSVIPTFMPAIYSLVLTALFI